VTVAVSLVLAFGFQLDSFKLVNRLAVDDNLRAKLVEQAQAVTPNNRQTQTNLSQQTKENLTDLQELATAKLITWPPYSHGWEDSTSIFGVLLSGLLISMGAPFWFKILGNLLKLRPQLAAKEDQQRAERQTSQRASA